MGWPLIIASAIGALGSYFAGTQGVKSQEKANQENIKYQEEFAKHGLSWRVQDAKDAGLHPLAALGAQTTSFQPSSVGGDYSYIEKMGQEARDLVRGLDQRSKNRQQIDDMKQLEELRHMELINMGLRKDLDGTSNDSVTDPMADPSKVAVQPSQPTAMGNPGIAAGIYPMMKYTQSPGGWIFPTPQQDIQELISEGMNPTQARYLKDWIKDRSMDIKHMKNPYSVGAHDYRNFLMEIRPTTYADGTPLKKGDEFRYKTNYGFKLFRNVKKSQFYVDDIGIANNNPVSSMVPKDLTKAHDSVKSKKTYERLLRQSRSKHFQ